MNKSSKYILVQDYLLLHGSGIVLLLRHVRGSGGHVGLLSHVPPSGASDTYWWLAAAVTSPVGLVDKMSQQEAGSSSGMRCDDGATN